MAKVGVEFRPLWFDCATVARAPHVRREKWLRRRQRPTGGSEGASTVAPSCRSSASCRCASAARASGSCASSPIVAISRAGTAVLLVEHHADLIFDICDRVTVLNLGKVLAAGTPAEIRSHREVVSAYLGA